MYNTTIFLVARRCEAEPSKITPIHLSPPIVQLTCEEAISSSASAQWLQSSKNSEWLANPWNFVRVPEP